MDVDDFFPVFADWAKKTSLDQASARFGPVIGLETLSAYVVEYRRRIADIENNDPPVVTGPHDPWYPGPGETDKYWPALEEFFQESLGWSNTSVTPVDRSSSKVVAYTPRPTQDAWTSRGLVVGYVQSGKTTNFTSVIAKAADVGYKLVIVLSGIHNGLRRQTQLRLDSQLRDLVPTDWMTLTDEVKDFYPPSMRSTALLHGHDAKIALCVAKKNHAVLNRLDKWLEDASRQGVLADLPTLIIDDEADQASVQTKTINPLIRKIIDKLPRCTYIGYTATPFANILIDPGSGDLYPSNFILNLPRPDGYFGTERIFGREAVEGDEANGTDLDGYDMVRTIPDEELENLGPSGKKAAQDFEPLITDSLDRAIKWFWLATAARRARGDHGHSTMLVHTSMKIAVHESYKVPLTDRRDAMVYGLEGGDRQLLADLSALWAEETARVPSLDFDHLRALTFDDVRAQLVEVVAQTKVVLDNCRSFDRLDYSQPGQIAIAVGGNTLSRGLTLEGLVVSFFVRAAGAYDTLLQMARWFGFRRGYEDLPRIWMTDQLKDWFRHLATVEHEIRMDIERYEQQGLTPLEFGIRIRTHPILRITAKMGAARSAYASYGGRRIQTRFFRESDASWLQSNLQAADQLLTAVRAAGGRATTTNSGAAIYRSVAAELILRFLSEYRSHEDSPDLDGELITKYIRKQQSQGSLEKWSIAVMAAATADLGAVSLGGLDFNRIARSKLRGTGPARADIKTLMSKDHRVIDLAEPSPPKARTMNENDLMDARNSDSEGSTTGLLLLYPIDPHSRPDKANEASRSPLEAVDDVIGMALVFPGNAEAKSGVANYVSVDLKYAEIEHEDAEEELLLREFGE